ncbi:MAG: aminopeptidase P family protein [Alphaproteobacteria bacterium]|nr:aminopeptidase P family protein [Alphaproteobacteria bacterium]
MFKDERKRTYLNPEGADRPLKSPVPHSVLEAARTYRLERFRQQLAEHDCAAMLLYDPLNVRYALDTPNMQVWTAHNAVRYALIFRDGPAIMFEFKGAFHLCDGKPAITEVRPAIAWIYMSAGTRSEERVAEWADEIFDLMKTHGRGNMRLAVDKLEPAGLWALEAKGVSCIEGQELTERARAIKSADELELMGWTIRVCEAGMARVYENSLPGKTEQELWAELHYENARSGGEWMETRLFLCGDHTNPWYSECSDRVCNEGEMISFDTDMIGPYGYCADLSRSWTCGHTAMSNKQAELYRKAVDQIEHNLGLLKAGLSFREFNEKSWQIPKAHQPYRYTLALHGVGMADEWPVVPLHVDFALAYDGEFEENMVICVESLMAEEGSESIKLETQVLITENGAERLDSFPWEDV